MAPTFADSIPDASTHEVVALRNAIADLTATFGRRYLHVQHSHDG